MSRTASNILNGLVKNLVAYAASVGLTIDPTKWSKTDYKKLTLSTISDATSVSEQLYDNFTSDIQLLRKVLPPQSQPWFQDQMLNNFQYSATNPQVLSLVNSQIFVPKGTVTKNSDGTLTMTADTINTMIPMYSVKNTLYNIVKNCAVVGGFSGSTIIKIAGANSSQITGDALTAAQSFVNQIKVPGINVSVISLNSAKLFLQLDVYYNGFYSSSIRASVKSAISNYLNSIPFNGVVTLSKLEEAILATEGVNDVDFTNVWEREDTQSIGTGISLVLNNTFLQRNCTPYAGYIVPETLSGYTLDDTRTGSSFLNLNLISE